MPSSFLTSTSSFLLRVWVLTLVSCNPLILEPCWCHGSAPRWPPESLSPSASAAAPPALCSHARAHTLPPSLPGGCVGRRAPAAQARVREKLGEPLRGCGQGRASRSAGEAAGADGWGHRDERGGRGRGGRAREGLPPGLACTPAPPSPGCGGPPRPPRSLRRPLRRGSLKACARRREHRHRGVPAASDRRRPGAPAPRRRLALLRGPLGPARAQPRMALL
nr:translation initiation factor IF-2-like [Manis javanica]XP_036877461.1 translation initiation factor IF-2-like [Manis javanica]XP_036877462.1 translation initiation factor IF-2-like [Manis javanica]